MNLSKFQKIKAALLVSLGAMAVVSESRAEIKTEAGVGLTSYVAADPADRVSFSDFSGRVRGASSNTESLQYGLDLELAFHTTQRGAPVSKPTDSFISGEASELYLGSGPISFGRKKIHWSELDESWDLGVWQPRYRWDVIHPEQVGLTGLFFHTETNDLSIDVAGLPIYIPERGSSLEFHDGAVSSRSPWASAPPDQMVISDSGQPTHVRYELDAPSISDVVLKNWGLSARMRLGREKGQWFNFAYAYKPMNQILVSHNENLHLWRDELNVKLYPRFVYHHLAAMEGGYRGQVFGASASFLGEVPNAEKTPSEWTNQEVKQSFAVSISGNWNFTSSSRLDLSYLYQLGGNAADSGAFAQAGRSGFEYRYPYQRAWKLGVKTSLFSPNLSWASSVLYDVGHSGAIVSAGVGYQFRRSWKAELATDVLISNLSARDPEATATLISAYRGNDRFRAGLSYVF